MRSHIKCLQHHLSYRLPFFLFSFIVIVSILFGSNYFAASMKTRGFKEVGSWLTSLGTFGLYVNTDKVYRHEESRNYFKIMEKTHAMLYLHPLFPSFPFQAHVFFAKIIYPDGSETEWREYDQDMKVFLDQCGSWFIYFGNEQQPWLVHFDVYDEKKFIHEIQKEELKLEDQKMSKNEEFFVDSEPAQTQTIVAQKYLHSFLNSGSPGYQLSPTVFLNDTVWGHVTSESTETPVVHVTFTIGEDFSLMNNNQRLEYDDSRVLITTTANTIAKMRVASYSVFDHDSLGRILIYLYDVDSKLAILVEDRSFVGRNVKGGAFFVDFNKMEGISFEKEKKLIVKTFDMLGNEQVAEFTIPAQGF